MSNIIATGFSVESVDGELDSLEVDLRRLSALGVDAVELGLTSIDLIAGGRIIKERAERLVALTGGFPFRYTVHGLVSSNFMDPATAGYQLQAAKALVEICDRIGPEHWFSMAGTCAPTSLSSGRKRTGGSARRC
jgi:sugar phosphate isomerase/epimerase